MGLPCAHYCFHNTLKGIPMHKASYRSAGVLRCMGLQMRFDLSTKGTRVTCLVPAGAD